MAGTFKVRLLDDTHRPRIPFGVVRRAEHSNLVFPRAWT
jgi:hypothetical protein